MTIARGAAKMLTTVLVLAPLCARAQTSTAPSWTQMTGKELAAACHSAEPAKRALCVGYVTAIYDLQFAPTPPQGVCPPANLNPDLLAEVAMAYMDTHDDGPAAAAIGQSIVRFFPCIAGAPKR